MFNFILIFFSIKIFNYFENLNRISFFFGFFNSKLLSFSSYLSDSVFSPFASVRHFSFSKIVGYNFEFFSNIFTNSFYSFFSPVFFCFLIFLRFFLLLFFLVFKTSFLKFSFSFDFIFTRLYFFKLFFLNLGFLNYFSFKKDFNL